MRTELTSRDLGRIAELESDGSDLVVRFRWMGTTELRYTVETVGDGFRATLSGERVAPLHAAFRQSFDERFDQVLAKVGARTI